jgi:hypothetical protein
MWRWVPGVPPLAVEYAGSGQDEVELESKIQEFLERGTRFIWVVRLVGPRRVDVYERGQARRTVALAGELSAPGILRNPVPVRALFDREAAHEVTLRNLLERRGYADLEAVKRQAAEEGRELGLEQGKELGLEQGKDLGAEEVLRLVIRDLCEDYALGWDQARAEYVAGLRREALDTLRRTLQRDRRFPPRPSP